MKDLPEVAFIMTTGMLIVLFAGAPSLMDAIVIRVSGLLC